MERKGKEDRSRERKLYEIKISVVSESEEMLTKSIYSNEGMPKMHRSKEKACKSQI